MKYKRNRTESLTIRLTPTEKKMLQSRAKDKHMSMTDYILLSALEHGDTNRSLSIFKKLSDIKNALLKLQQKENSVAVCDTLEKQQEVFDEVIAAIKRG